MNIFKDAVKQKIRFESVKGPLTLEQLYDLSRSDIARAIKAQAEIIDEQSGDDNLSFLGENNSVDAETQLKFDVLKEVYMDMKAEEEAKRAKARKKAHNEEIMSLIEEKKKENLKGKDLAELEAMLIN